MFWMSWLSLSRWHVTQSWSSIHYILTSFQEAAPRPQQTSAQPHNLEKHRSLPFLQGWQHGAFSHRMHILGAIRVGNNVTSHRTSHAHFNSKSSLTVALFSSFANMTMAGCQTNRANSFHYLGGLDVCGLRELCVSKLRSPANKCECACACTKIGAE